MSTHKIIEFLVCNGIPAISTCLRVFKKMVCKVMCFKFLIVSEDEPVWSKTAVTTLQFWITDGR